MGGWVGAGAARRARRPCGPCGSCLHLPAAALRCGRGCRQLPGGSRPRPHLTHPRPTCPRPSPGGELPAQLVELVRLLLLPEPQLEALLEAVGAWAEQWVEESAGAAAGEGEGEDAAPWGKEAEEALRGALARLAAPAGPEADAQPAAKKRKVGGGGAQDAAAPAASVAGVLLAVCRTMCRRYAGGLAEDEAEAAALGQLPPRRQAALLARLQEKRGWAALVAAVEGAAAQLDAAALSPDVLLEGAKQMLLSMQQPDSDSDSDDMSSDEDEDGSSEEEEQEAGKQQGKQKGKQQGKAGGKDCCDEAHCSHGGAKKKGKAGRGK